MAMRHLVLMVAMVGCGNDAVHHLPAPDAPAIARDAAGAGSGSAGDAAPELLQAPVLDTLKPGVPGPSLVVGWENPTPDCDTVEVWRKDALDPYVVIATPPGTATAYEDTTATQNENYTFRLRCVKAGAGSPFSSEESANPRGG